MPYDSYAKATATKDENYQADRTRLVFYILSVKVCLSYFAGDVLAGINRLCSLICESIQEVHGCGRRNWLGLVVGSSAVPER